jgi:hypothetical protein
MFPRFFSKCRLDYHFQSQSGSRPKNHLFSNHQMATVGFPCNTWPVFPLFTSRIRIFFLHMYRQHPLLRINLHIVFLHTFIFSELLNLFVVMSNNEAFQFALKLRIIFRPWRSSKLYLLPNFLYYPVIHTFKMLYTVVFGIFNILATSPYELPPLINSTMESLWPTDQSFDLHGILRSAVYLRLEYREANNTLLTSFMTFPGVI